MILEHCYVIFYSSREALKEDEEGSLQSSVEDIVNRAKRRRLLERPLNVRLGMVSMKIRNLKYLENCRFIKVELPGNNNCLHHVLKLMCSRKHISVTAFLWLVITICLSPWTRQLKINTICHKLPNFYEEIILSLHTTCNGKRSKVPKHVHGCIMGSVHVHVGRPKNLSNQLPIEFKFSHYTMLHLLQTEQLNA